VALPTFPAVVERLLLTAGTPAVQQSVYGQLIAGQLIAGQLSADS